MKVADRGSQDGGPAIGSSFLLTIKSSPNPSRVPFELELTDKSRARVVNISRSRYSTMLWEIRLTCELIHYCLRATKVIHRCKRRRKNLLHSLHFPNPHKLQGKKIRREVHLKIPRGTQPMYQMLGWYLLKAGSKHMSSGLLSSIAFSLLVNIAMCLCVWSDRMLLTSLCFDNCHDHS